MHFGIAMALAAETHKEQFDRGGKAYILHPMRIAMRLRTNDDELMSIAVLHDVVEDSKGDVTFDTLRDLGFSTRVIDALRLLTHDPSEDYMVYVERIATNYDALRVKMEDLRDNSDITRLKGVREKDFKRLEKYSKAYMYLAQKRSEMEMKA